MIVSALFATALLQPGPFLLERAGRAHAAMGSVEVVATYRAKTLLGDESREVTLTRDGRGGLDVRVAGPRAQRLVVAPDGVWQVDPARRAYALLERVPPSPAEALGTVAQLLDPLVVAIADGGAVKVWAMGMGDPGDWRLRPGATPLTLVSQAGGATLTLDREYRVAAFETRSPDGTSRWAFTYRPWSGAIAFTPDSGYSRVPELAAAMLPPVFDSAQARRAFERAMTTYDRPRRLAVEFKSAGEAVRVWIAGGAVRQDDGVVDWVYDGKRLVLRSASETIRVEGEATPSEVGEAVRAAGSRIDPMVRQLVIGANPIRSLLGNRPVVRIAGRIEVGGKACTLIESKAPDRTFSLVVRDSDGFLLSVAGSAKEWGYPAPRTIRPIEPRPMQVAAGGSGQVTPLKTWLAQATNRQSTGSDQ